MDLPEITALIVSIGAIAASVLSYRRNRKADDALNLGQRIDSVLGGQQHLIEDLRAEADRNRDGWNACLARCASLQEESDRQRDEIDELHEVVNILRAKLNRAGLT